MTHERVVCVLSGGGAKAAAHVGAYRALEERGTIPIHFVGTSMGAVIAACFASGLSYEDVLARITAVGRFDVARPSPGLLLGPFAQSLLSDRPLRRTIGRLVPARRFADLEHPLTVTAVDDRSGELVLMGAAGWEQVPLLDALYASCALPIYYPPADIGNRSFLDGGLRSVLPLEVARKFRPDWVFGVRVGPALGEVPPGDVGRLPPLLGTHNFAMRILMAAQTEREIDRFRSGSIPLVLVEPELEEGTTFDVGGAVAYVEAGYAAAVRALQP